MKYLRPVIVLAMLAGFGFAQDEPKKVSRADALGAVVTKVQPEYPPMARQLHVQGTVELEVLVTDTGAVGKVTIVSGNPLLTGPSAESVKRWKFKPFTEDGKPVAVVAPITLNFKL